MNEAEAETSANIRRFTGWVRSDPGHGASQVWGQGSRGLGGCTVSDVSEPNLPAADSTALFVVTAAGEIVSPEHQVCLDPAEIAFGRAC